MEETYTIKKSCSNCGYTGHGQLERGTPISVVKEVECPNCGCKTLSYERNINEVKFSNQKGGN